MDMTGFDMNWLRGVMTIVWMVCFIGIVYWAYHPATRKRFDEAEQLPFNDELPSDKTRKEIEQ